MAEKVLPNPLSGEEVRTAILDHISERLAKDGYLNLNLAYDSFSAKITIHIDCHDIGRVATVDVEETITPVSAEPITDDQFLNQADGEFEIPAAAPNEVRVETGQPVPVLTKDTDGSPTVKGIRYSRKATKK